MAVISGGDHPNDKDFAAAPKSAEETGGEAWAAVCAPVTARNCSVVSKDGKLRLFDNDAEQFITIPWDDAEGGVSEMLEFEPIWDDPIEDFPWDSLDDEEEDEYEDDIGEDGACGADADEEDECGADADEDDEYDADAGGDEDEEEPERELLGYRYRLEKDGAWGFISRCFSQSLSPRFREFRTCYSVPFAPFKGGLWSWSVREPEYEEASALLELWYSEEHDTQHEYRRDLVMKSAFALAESWFDRAYGDEPQEEGAMCFPDDVMLPTEDAIPGEEPFFSVIEGSLMDWEKGGWRSSIVYAPEREGVCYVVGYTEQGEERNFHFYEICAEERKIRSDPFIGREMPFLDWDSFWSSEANFRIEFGELMKLPWHEPGELEYLGGDYYAVCRDGYWALMDYRRHKPTTPYGSIRLKKLLTPYAFTRIEPLTNPKALDPYFLIERFGKWGVLRIGFEEDTVEYPIPCEYESVRLEIDDAMFDSFSNLKGRFFVSRMGSVGELDLDGNWVVHLHREEDA